MKKKFNFFNWLKKHAKKGVLVAVLAVMLLSSCFAFLGHSKSYNADAFAFNNYEQEMLPYGGGAVTANINQSFLPGEDNIGFETTYPTTGSINNFSGYTYLSTPYLSFTNFSRNSTTDYNRYVFSVPLGGRNSFNNANRSIVFLSYFSEALYLPYDYFNQMLDNTSWYITCTASNRMEFFGSMIFLISGYVVSNQGDFHSLAVERTEDIIGSTMPTNRTYFDTVADGTKATVNLFDYSFFADTRNNSTEFSERFIDLRNEQLLLDNYVIYQDDSLERWICLYNFSMRIACATSGFPTVSADSTSFNFEYRSNSLTSIPEKFNGLRSELTLEALEDLRNNQITNFAQPILGFVEDFFNMELFPNFRISYILMLGVGALIFGFVLKFFLGG